MNKAIIEISNCYDCIYCKKLKNTDRCKLVEDPKVYNQNRPIPSANKCIPMWCPMLDNKMSVVEHIRMLKFQENEGNASQEQIDSYRLAIDDVLSVLYEIGFLE